MAFEQRQQQRDDSLRLTVDDVEALLSCEHKPTKNDARLLDVLSISFKDPCENVQCTPSIIRGVPISTTMQDLDESSEYRNTEDVSQVLP